MDVADLDFADVAERTAQAVLRGVVHHVNRQVAMSAVQREQQIPQVATAPPPALQLAPAWECNAAGGAAVDAGARGGDGGGRGSMWHGERTATAAR